MKKISRPLYHVHFTVIHTNSRHKNSDYGASLQWRYNGRNDVSNHQPHPCLRNRSWAQIKENTKAPRHWPLCGNSSVTGEFPTQKASNAENVSIWWRHHVLARHPFAQIMHATSWHGHTFRITGPFQLLPNWGVLCQKQVSWAGTSNYIPQYLWDVITSPWYLLVAERSSIVQRILRLNSTAGLMDHLIHSWCKLNECHVCKIINDWLVTKISIITPYSFQFCTWLWKRIAIYPDVNNCNTSVFRQPYTVCQSRTFTGVNLIFAPANFLAPDAVAPFTGMVQPEQISQVYLVINDLESCVIDKTPCINGL